MTDAPGGAPASPVFVVGASRSGTALVRSALNRHSAVFLAGETHYFDDLRTRLTNHGAPPLSEGEQRETEDYFLALAHRPYGHGGDPAHSRLDRADLRAAAAALGGGGDAYFEAYCRLSRRLEPDSAADPVVWGEKTPRHVFRLDDVLSRYEDARVVCMVRDPRAVVASYRDWQHQGGFDLGADEGHRDALEEEHRRTRASYDPTLASLLWKATVAASRKAQARYGAERVRIQRYEDVALQPDASLREVAEFLGLHFEPGMLDVPLHNSSFSTFTATAGVSTVPVERWRALLSPHEVAIVELWCGRDLDALGYERRGTAMSTRDKAELAARLPVALARAGLANRHRMGRVGAYVARRAMLLLRR